MVPGRDRGERRPGFVDQTVGEGFAPVVVFADDDGVTLLDRAVELRRVMTAAGEVDTSAAMRPRRGRLLEQQRGEEAVVLGGRQSGSGTDHRQRLDAGHEGRRAAPELLDTGEQPAALVHGGDRLAQIGVRDLPTRPALDNADERGDAIPVVGGRGLRRQVQQVEERHLGQDEAVVGARQRPQGGVEPYRAVGVVAEEKEVDGERPRFEQPGEDEPRRLVDPRPEDELGELRSIAVTPKAEWEEPCRMDQLAGHVGSGVADDPLPVERCVAVMTEKRLECAHRPGTAGVSESGRDVTPSRGQAGRVTLPATENAFVRASSSSRAMRGPRAGQAALRRRDGFPGRSPHACSATARGRAPSVAPPR